MIYFMLVMCIISCELEPPEKWWQALARIITWPEVVGRWMKQMVESK